MQKEMAARRQASCESFSLTNSAPVEETNSSGSSLVDTKERISGAFAPSGQLDIMARSRAGPRALGRSVLKGIEGIIKKPGGGWRAGPESADDEEEASEVKSAYGSPSEAEDDEPFIKTEPDTSEKKVDPKINKAWESFSSKYDRQNPRSEKKVKLPVARFKSAVPKAFTEEQAKKDFALPLPEKFLHLCRLASALDVAINYFRVRNKKLIFEDLKDSIESMRQL